MMRYISDENFKKAENKAFTEDIHIRRAVSGYCSRDGEIEILEPSKVLKLVKARAENSHKGSFGRLVFVGGSDRYAGAVQLASLAALRSGVGLLSVVTSERAAIALSSAAREATLLPVPSDADGFMCPDGKIDDITELIKKADAVLLGCGLGTGNGCMQLVELVIKNAECPIILDADGINLVSHRIELLRRAKAELILTPHPAELARLCGAPIDEVMADRYGYARQLADEFGCTVVSKSSGTLILGDGNAYLSVRGNNGLSRGGSGDLLAGLIASFAAQGYSPVDCAKIGVTLQGLACEAASKKLSRRGMLPSDVIDFLPLLFKKIER